MLVTAYALPLTVTLAGTLADVHFLLDGLTYSTEQPELPEDVTLHTDFVWVSVTELPTFGASGCVSEVFGVELELFVESELPSSINRFISVKISVSVLGPVVIY